MEEQSISKTAVFKGNDGGIKERERSGEQRKLAPVPLARVR